MRRVVTVVLAAGLLIAGIGAPADAKKAKGVKTVLYLHGTSGFGEEDSFVHNSDFLPMDVKKPTGSSKSKQITNYVVGPNVNCAGNNLFPVWIGNVSGKITGDIKVTFPTQGTPGTILIRVWPDTAADGAALCNESYPKPAGEVEASLGATVEAVIPKVNFTAKSFLLFQVSPVIEFDIPDPGGAILSPFVARIQYDSPDAPASIEFTCTPTKGKSCA
ncbi:MAG: hypothetical protein ACRDH6_05090 [Actinomycetota bacterium]